MTVAVGLVGCGRWGRNILRDLIAGGARVSIADTSPEAREQALAAGAAAAVESIAELGAVEGFVVATPSATHAGVLDQLLPLGKPMFVEKPMATDVQSARRLAQAARGRLFVMQKWRYHPGIEYIRAQIGAGALGEIRAIRIIRWGWGSLADDNAIWRLMPHDLAITLHWLGYVPPLRTVMLTNPVRFDAALIAQLGSPSRPQVTIDMSSVSPVHRRCFTVIGSAASMELGDAFSPEVTVRRGAPGEQATREERVAIAQEMPLAAEIRAFVEHLHGGPPPMTDAAEDLQIVERVAEIDAAARKATGMVCRAVDHERAPRFSVVLPTHNRADVLAVAIRSALWQTARDFELLIAGDGCTDRTADVVRSFDDPRIRWYDLPKADGVGYANRNRVLREARGTHIAYLGHDDIWFPDHLERLAARLEDRDAELVYSRLLAVDPYGRLRPYSYNLEVPRHRATLWRADMAMTMTSVMYTRACLAKYGYWSEELASMADVEMWHRIVAGGGFRRAAFVAAPTLLHFVSRKPAAAHARALRWLTRGLVEEAGSLLPSWPIDPGETPQHAAWRHLAGDPSRRVQDIRDGVVRFQDALLWSARSKVGLAGLRFGVSLGAGLDRLVRGFVRSTSPRWRAASSKVRAQTAPREAASPDRQDAPRARS